MAQAESNAPARVMTESPPAVDPAPTQPTADQPVEETPLDPQVASLQAIFPDFDPIVLQSVLASVNGNQDRAIDKLLGMSDPEYQEQQPDQTELDAEFARSLLIQEQEETNRRRQRQQRHAPQEAAPYQQRVHTPSQNPPGTNPNNMQEVTDTFNKLAESGKKTFSTLFSKVKAKIQDLDQPRPDPGSPSTGNGGGSLVGPPSHQDRHAVMTQAHYQQPPTTNTQPARGYDMSYQSSPTSASEQPPTTFSTKPDQRASSPDIVLASSQSNQQASNIDPAKLGILPKRPVTLGGPPSPPRESTEELEYAENPFEDGRHK